MVPLETVCEHFLPSRSRHTSCSRDWSSDVCSSDLLAIARAGHEPVARLLPSPRDPLLLASVRVAGPYGARPAERDLYAAIRLIGRGPLTRHPPRGVLVALKEAAAVEGASLRELSQADAPRIGRGYTAADPDLHRATGTRVIGKLLPVRDFSSRPGGRPASPACEPGPRLAGGSAT